MSASGIKLERLKPLLYLPAAGVVAAVSSIAFHYLVLGGVPHVSDEVIYIFQAKTYARLALAAPAPAAPAFFTYLNLIIDDAGGVWFGIYPPGWPALLAPFARAGIMPWANAIINALALIAIYRLGCEFFGRKVALLALALALASPFAWVMGASYLSHPLALLLATAALLGPTVGLRTDRGRWIVFSGIAAGALTVVRPLDGLAVAVTLALMLARNRQWKGLGIITLAAAPFVAALLLYNRALTSSFWVFPQQLYNPRDALGFGAGVGKIATYGSVGHTPWKAALNLGHNLRALSTNLFGWPFISFVFIPFAYITRRHRHRRGLLLLSVLAIAFTAAYACYWYDGVLYGPRFYYTLMPYFLLLSAAGIARAHQWARRRGARWLTPALLTAFFAFSAAAYVPHYVGKLRARYNLMDNEIFEEVRREGITDGVVLCPPNDRAYPSYGSVFWRNSPWLDTPLIWAKNLGPLNRQVYESYGGKRFWIFEGGEVLDAGVDGGEETEKGDR